LLKETIVDFDGVRFQGPIGIHGVWVNCNNYHSAQSHKDHLNKLRPIKLNKATLKTRLLSKQITWRDWNL